MRTYGTFFARLRLLRENGIDAFFYMILSNALFIFKFIENFL